LEDAVLTASRPTGTVASDTQAQGRVLPASPTLAALINPLSFRMSRGTRAQRSEALVRAHGGEVHEVTDLHGIESALARILSRPERQPVDRLVIAGGDGTVQGAVTWLAEKCPVPPPELIVLSAGRSNYIAGDISTSRHFQATLERILTTHQENLHSVQRVTLKLQHPSLDVQHGFFMAGALVDQIIRDVHRWSENNPGRSSKGHFGSALGVGRFGLRYLRKRNQPALPEVAVEADGLGRVRGRCRFLIATTLHLEGRPICPYARRGEGPLRISAVLAAATRWPWRIPRLLTGRYSNAMTAKNGYLSGHCETILIKNLDSITLDGQEFDLDPSQPLRLSAGPAMSFLRT